MAMPDFISRRRQARRGLLPYRLVLLIAGLWAVRNLPPSRAPHPKDAVAAFASVPAPEKESQYVCLVSRNAPAAP